MQTHDCPLSARSLLPRALIGRRPYSFAIGEVVSWHGENWLILGREASVAGRHIYKIYKEDDERPVRHADGCVFLSAAFGQASKSVLTIFETAPERGSVAA